MSSDDATPVQGKTIPATVQKTLPNARFRVITEHGGEVEAHVSGKMRMEVIRILPGDRVQIEVSPFDTKLARIVGRG